jgi:hypothetical protein
VIRYIFVVVIVLVVASSAWGATGRSLELLHVGLYFPTDVPAGLDADTGVAVNWTHLDRANWYASIEGDFFQVSETAFIPGFGFVEDTADISSAAFTIGPLLRDRKRVAYAGLGIGFTTASADIGDFGSESDTGFAWEILAGSVSRPLGAQVRYRHSEARASTGVTAALTYIW